MASRDFISSVEAIWSAAVARHRAPVKVQEQEPDGVRKLSGLRADAQEHQSEPYWNLKLIPNTASSIPSCMFRYIVASCYPVPVTERSIVTSVLGHINSELTLGAFGTDNPLTLCLKNFIVIRIGFGRWAGVGSVCLPRRPGNRLP